MAERSRVLVAGVPGVHGQVVEEETLQDEERTQQAVAGCVTVVHRPAPDLPLDRALRGTYHLAKAAAAAGVERFLLLSCQDFFERLPVPWVVNPHWRPRPSPDEAQLRALLSELSVRELLRGTATRGYVLRIGAAGEDAMAAAIQAAQTEEPRGRSFWRVQHVGERPGAPADDRPWRTVLAPPAPVPSRPIRKVVLFGAAGPLGAATFRVLKERFWFRLADIQPLAQVAQNGYPHQPPGAPLPLVPETPHEEVYADVTDAAQVRAACEGMDAIVNCAVIRHSPRDFAVNMLGAVHMARAAVDCGIRRVVQTGPHQIINQGEGGYQADWEIPGNAPERPGPSLYPHTKFLGQEALRVFAEWHDLEVPVLLFNGFLTGESRYQLGFGTSFEDGGRAIGKALDVGALPSPYEPMNIAADVPLGQISLERATTVLGWHPEDNFEDTWRETVV